jgi:hypothetical protein
MAMREKAAGLRPAGQAGAPVPTRFLPNTIATLDFFMPRIGATSY